MSRDVEYYTLLGLDRDCSADDVKKAYKREALRWHPDKNLDNREEAELRFRLIAEAYEVLGDGDKRAYYDRTGARLKDMPNDFAGVSTTGRRSGREEFMDPFSLFDAFFGTSAFGGVFEEVLGRDPFADFFNTGVPFARSRTQRQPFEFGFGHGSLASGFFGDPFGDLHTTSRAALRGGSLFDDPFFRGGGSGATTQNQSQSRQSGGGDTNRNHVLIDLTGDDDIEVRTGSGSRRGEYMPRTSSRTHGMGHGHQSQHQHGHAHAHGHGHRQQQQHHHHHRHHNVGGGTTHGGETGHTGSSGSHSRRIRIHIS